ncbi:hypothetical protein ACVNP0_08830 [Staphylococcus aureus]
MLNTQLIGIFNRLEKQSWNLNHLPIFIKTRLVAKVNVSVKGYDDLVFRKFSLYIMR